MENTNLIEENKQAWPINKAKFSSLQEIAEESDSENSILDESIPESYHKPLLNTLSFSKPSLDFHTTRNVAIRRYSSNNESSLSNFWAEKIIPTTDEQSSAGDLSTLISSSDFSVGFKALPNPSNAYKTFSEYRSEAEVIDSTIFINKVKADNNTRACHKIPIIMNEKKNLREYIEGNYNYKELNDLKEGYLLKKSKHKGWIKKYCRMGQSKFIFYKNTEAKLLSGCLDFARLTPILEYSNKLFTFTIIIKKNNREDKAFIFKAENNKELLSWINSIEYNLKLVSNKIKVPPSIDYYWKVFII